MDLKRIALVLSLIFAALALSPRATIADSQEVATPANDAAIPLEPFGETVLNCQDRRVSLRLIYVRNVFDDIAEDGNQPQYPFVDKDCSSFTVMGACGTTSYSIYGKIEGSFTNEASFLITLTCWSHRAEVVPEFATHHAEMRCQTDEGSIEINTLVMEHALLIFGGSIYRWEANCPGEEGQTDNF